MKRSLAAALALLGLTALAAGQAWLFSPAAQMQPAGGFVSAVDPNWWQNWQYAGTNPSVVLDFANGLYWNGSQTLTSPSTLVSGGTVTAGSGLAGATGVTATGAALSAFQGSAYNTQVNTVSGSASSNLGIIADNNGSPGPDMIIGTNTGGQGMTYPPLLETNTSSDFSKSVWQSLSNASGIRQLSTVGPSGSISGAVSDTNSYASPSTIFLGSWNGAFPFDGYLSTVAVLPSALANVVIPPRAFTGKNGWWYAGDATNSGITYGNILQFEYTQPWTVVVAQVLFKAAGGGHPGVSGIYYTNVTATAAFTGHEFWPDGNGHATVRVINTANTAWIDVNGGTFLADGKWHVVAETYDGSGLASGVHIYVDGVPETITVDADTLGGQSIVASGQNYVIGNQQSEAFAGAMAIGLFRHYTRVLTQAEIQNFKINFTVPPPDSSCALGPKLNEGGSSTTTGDFCSGNHTGTMLNANQWLRG